MEHCIFSQRRQCTTDSTFLMTPGAKRIETVISCSKIYSDNLHIHIEEKLKADTTFVIKSHKDCITTDTSKHNISRFSTRTGDTSTDSNRSPKKCRTGQNIQTLTFLNSVCFAEKHVSLTKTVTPGKMASSICLLNNR